MSWNDLTTKIAMNSSIAGVTRFRPSAPPPKPQTKDSLILNKILGQLEKLNDDTVPVYKLKDKNENSNNSEMPK